MTLRLSSSRLVVSYVLLVALSTAVLLGIAYMGSRAALQTETDALVGAESAGLLEQYHLAGRPGLLRALADAARATSRSGAVYLLVDPHQQRVAGNLAVWPSSLSPRPGWIEFDAAASNDDRDEPQPVRGRALRLGGGELLLVGTDLSEQRRALARFRASLAWGVGLASLLAAMLGAWHVRGVARRVRELAHNCEAVIGGQLEQRLPLAGSGDEFDQLATAVNRMLDRLESQTGVLRTTFDTAAHDLRAPLYRMRMRLEAALLQQDPDSQREALASALVDVDRVQRTLGMLLQIAQAEAGGLETLSERVDLDLLVREMVDLYAPVASAQGLQMSSQSTSGVLVDGNRQLLAQLLANLLENALKYVPPGGQVCIAVVQVADGIELTVSDDGPGIPAAERQRMLMPFSRLHRDEGCEGSGLGLSLVAAVARLHSAHIHLEDNSPGLKVRCIFPRQK